MAGARTRGAAAPRQRGCVRRLCSAPKLAAPRVMTQVCADQAADGSGSCRSVGRVSTLGAVCRGVSEVWCVVGVGSRLAWLSIFKETGQSSRQNPKKNPVGSQSSRRLAALDGPAALRHCVRCYLQKNTSLSCTFWEPDPQCARRMAMRRAPCVVPAGPPLTGRSPDGDRSSNGEPNHLCYSESGG